MARLTLAITLALFVAGASAAPPNPFAYPRGVCSAVLDKCNADAKCAAILRCFEACTVDPMGTSGAGRPVMCAIGCNAGGNTIPAYKAYISCLVVASQTYATATAVNYIDAPPQTVWNLLKEFKDYPSWTNGRLKFLPAPTAQGKVFLLLTKIGFLPPAPVPCKLNTFEFNAATGVGSISFGGSIVPGTGRSIFGYEHQFLLARSGAGTLLTNTETWGGAIMPFTPFVWTMATYTYQGFNNATATQLGVAATSFPIALTCEGQCQPSVP